MRIKFIKVNKLVKTFEDKNHNYFTRSKINKYIHSFSKKHFVFGFSKREVEKNNYEILGVPYDADLETIKKAYFKLAKKYHPDLNSETGSEEKFKKIKAAYEVIGDPANRVSYDLEMNYNNDNSKYIKKERYNKASYAAQGPRTVKSFYGDKWSGYKVPNWVNLFSGKDMKSEYINRKEDDDPFETTFTESRIKRMFIRFRIVFYLMFVFLIDIFLVIDNHHLVRKYFMYKSMFIQNELNENK
jgi:hypothetical protein